MSCADSERRVSIKIKTHRLIYQNTILGSPPVFGGVRVARVFSSFCVVFVVLIVFILCLVYPMLSVSLDCLHPVSCLPNVVSVSGLSSSCVLFTQCCQCVWIVFILCLVYPVLSVSLDCPFLMPLLFALTFITG